MRNCYKDVEGQGAMFVDTEVLYRFRKTDRGWRIFDILTRKDPDEARESGSYPNIKSITFTSIETEMDRRKALAKAAIKGGRYAGVCSGACESDGASQMGLGDCALVGAVGSLAAAGIRGSADCGALEGGLVAAIEIV